MKRVLLSAILGVFLLGAVNAATSVKFTFTDVDFVDASGNVVATGTIQAAVKSNQKTQLVTCSYFTDPTNQYVGQFQGSDATVNGDSASAVQTFCEQNFQNRQTLPR